MNFSRSLLISSIVRVAMTRRSWPRMMSWACSRICCAVEVEQSLGGVVHEHRVGGDADGEGRGHVDADVVERERAFEGDVDDHGLEGEVGVVLDEGMTNAPPPWHAARGAC
jgi:hypothetical protein